MKKYLRSFCCFLLIFALAPGCAWAEETMLVRVGDGGFYAETALSSACEAGGRVYFWDQLAHSYFSMTPQGEERLQASSITWLDAERYRMGLTLLGGGEQACALEATVWAEEGEIVFEEFGLYRLDPANLERELVAEVDLSEAVLGGGGVETLTDFQGALLADGWLYTLFDSPETSAAFLFNPALTKRFLLCQELSTGKLFRRELTGALQLVYAKGGQVAYARALADTYDAALIALDPETGEERQLMILEGQGGAYPRQIAYFPRENFLTFLSGSRVWGRRKGEAARIVGGVSVEAPVEAFAVGDRLAVYGRREAALLDLDWQMEMETRRLVVQSNVVQMNDFARLRPDVEIVSDFTQEAELVSAILTRTALPDVIVTETSSQHLFRPLRDRGYLLPLRGRAIEAVGQAVYPQILAEVSNEQGMVALPVSLLHGQTMKIQDEHWRELGLGEVPSSWPELLQVLHSWPELAREHPDLCPFLENMDADGLSRCLMDLIINSYDLYRGEQESEIGYGTEVFRQLVRLHGELDFEMLAQAYTGGDLDGVFQLLGPSGVEFSAPGYRDLALAVEAGGQPLMGEGLWVIMINPYSQNQDLAMELLEYVAANLLPIDRLEMMPGENEPLRREGYEASLIEQQEYISDLEARLERAEDPEERGEMQVELEMRKQNLESSRNSWQASPESIAGYRAGHEHIRIRYLDSLNREDYNTVGEIRQRFVSGEMDVEQFIEEMDRRLLMRALEGE